MSRSLSMTTHMDARLKHLTRTNEAPSDSETVEIRRFIAQERDEISALEFQLERTQPPPEHLLPQHAEHSARLMTFKSIISPVRRLPPELVGEIFLFCCPKRATLLSDRYSCETHLTICQICSGWRQVALELNQLWNCVLFTHTPTDPDSEYDSDSSSGYTPPYMEENAVLSEKDIDFAMTWLSRAGSLPLDIAFEYSRYECADAPIQHILLPVVQRCRVIKLLVPEISLPRLFNFPTGSFDLLESLAIERFSSWLPSTALFHSATSLRYLALDYHISAESISQTVYLSLPWSQLTSLQIHVHAVHYDDSRLELPLLFTILEHCINLLELHVNVLATNRPGPNTSMVLLPRLRALRLMEGASYGLMASLFSFLMLPALKELRVPSDIPIDVFAAFVSRSALTLDSLYLIHHPDLLVQVLRYTPSLKFLSVDAGFPDVAMTAIAQYELVPQLQTLCMNLPWSPEGFLTMVESRRPRRPNAGSQSRLKCLVLRHYDTSGIEERLREMIGRRLDEWRQDGLDIRYEGSRDYLEPESWSVVPSYLR